MNQAEYFHINSPQVVHETIEGETVIVNLLNGNYYNVSGTGSVIWQLIDNGASRQQMSAYLEQWYSGDPTVIQSGLETFLSKLESEGLVIKTVNPERSFKVERISIPEGRQVFETPASELAIFSDMQNLLLIDPVHEVTDRGWPHATSDTNESTPNPA